MSVVRITLLLATIVAVLERPAHAGAIELDRATASILIHPRVDVVRDEGGRLTLEEVRGRFDRSTVGAYSFGFTNAAYWYRFTIANRSTSTLTRLLVFRTPWLDRVVLYEPRANGRYRTRTFGDRLPFHQRELDHRCFVLRLEIPRGETTYYARLQVSQAFMTPISLWQPEAFRVDDSRRSHYFGAIYGVILVMLLYNLFIFLSIRDTRYLYYCFYLFAFGLMNVSYNGYSFAYLWPNAPTFSNWTYSSWIFLFQLTGLLFAIKFLETRKRSPRLHAVVLGVCGVMCATWGGSMLFGLELIYNASAVFFVSLYSPLVALAGIVVWRTGYRAARFFVVASLATLVGSFVTAATAAGFIRYSFATFHATEFGLMIDITLLSFALADRLRLAQAEHELAQKQTRSALETLVHERTAELERERDRAEELARTDPLTKLANRRAFEEQIAREFERARRYSRDLSLIVFDLDSFKQINDSHGHAAGDAVLQAVAELALGVSRSSDFVGRIGGEEFAIICPETPAREATTIAERLRAAIDVLAVPLEGATLHTSGSFGVASLSDEIGDVATLMRAADGRMYRAKRRGRNAVVGEPDQHRLLAADAEASRATAEHERRIESIDGEKNREIGGKRESGSTQSGE